MNELYIGLMSGTSADGIDAALVDFSQYSPQMIATHYMPYTDVLRQKILALCQEGDDEIKRLGELDIVLGKTFAQAVNDLLMSQKLSANCIKAIGSHGQTIRHHPRALCPFTLQIGDPNIIAAETGITTVADFRRKDIATGGQGAPLVPAFHQEILRSEKEHRAIVNIGGIANISLLMRDCSANNIIGFDTGPGNVLMDAWMQLHHHQTRDENGAWAAQGTLQPDLLEALLADPYFQLAPPKSSGREYFNLAWLQTKLRAMDKTFLPIDVQRTLAELTAVSILNSIREYFSAGEMLICGGGVHNIFLMSRLRELAQPHLSVHSTEKYDLHPDWVEAVAFAWLAKQTLNRKSGNLPSVTGATKPSILGGIYFA